MFHPENDCTKQKHFVPRTKTVLEKKYFLEFLYCRYSLICPTKISIINIFDQNFNVWPFRFFTKISIFDQISIFYQNFDFLPKFRFFPKISIFDQNCNFWPNFSTKITMCHFDLQRKFQWNKSWLFSIKFFRDFIPLLCYKFIFALSLQKTFHNIIPINHPSKMSK